MLVPFMKAVLKHSKETLSNYAPKFGMIKVLLNAYPLKIGGIKKFKVVVFLNQVEKCMKSPNAEFFKENLFLIMQL